MKILFSLLLGMFAAGCATPDLPDRTYTVNGFDLHVVHPAEVLEKSGGESIAFTAFGMIIWTPQSGVIDGDGNAEPRFWLTGHEGLHLNGMLEKFHD